MNKTNATQQAEQFLAAAKAAGFRVSVEPNMVRITKSFASGDNAAFVDCDMSYGSVLSLAPLKGGSVWGTDGGSVGGYSALTRGQFVMSKSGTAKRFTAALAKLVS